MRRIIALLLLLTTPSAFAATLLVLNKQDSTPSFIDPDSGRTLAVLPTGSSPHEAEVTADGGMAVVTNYGGQTAGNSLTVVDITARRERTRVDLGDLRSRLAVVDLETLAVSGHVATGAGPDGMAWVH